MTEAGIRSATRTTRAPVAWSKAVSLRRCLWLRRMRRAAAIPIVRARTYDLASGPLPLPLPLVYVETTNRPDVVDLRRVLALEPAADVTSCWRIMTGGPAQEIFLRLRVIRPVRCRLWLAFGDRAHLPFLADVAREGQVFMTTRDPEHDLQAAVRVSLSFPVDVTTLRAALTEDRPHGR